MSCTEPATEAGVSVMVESERGGREAVSVWPLTVAMLAGRWNCFRR